jgi:AraC-like DNA-binding protein
VNWLSVILLAGATQGVILSLALFTLPRGNRTGNRCLAVLIVLFALSMAWRALMNKEYGPGEARFLPIELTLILCYGPLLWFYVKAVAEPPLPYAHGRLLHFLPAAISALAHLVSWWPGGREKVISAAAVSSAHPSGLEWVVLAHILAYLLVSFRTLRRHARRMTSSFSSLERMQLHWLRYLLIICALDWILALAWQLAVPAGIWAQLPWLFLSIVMYAIGYFALRQPEIFTGSTQATLEAMPPVQKYQKSTLSVAKAEEYSRKLQAFMSGEKPYRNSDLNLPGLAKMLAVPPHHLSQIINEKLQQNFFEFVNRHRVAEAQQLLNDPAYAHLNIAEIGFSAGFSSISAFNAAFKKHTGMTPSQFRKNGAP